MCVSSFNFICACALTPSVFALAARLDRADEDAAPQQRDAGAAGDGRQRPRQQDRKAAGASAREQRAPRGRGPHALQARPRRARAVCESAAGARRAAAEPL